MSFFHNAEVLQDNKLTKREMRLVLQCALMRDSSMTTNICLLKKVDDATRGDFYGILACVEWTYSDLTTELPRDLRVSRLAMELAPDPGIKVVLRFRRPSLPAEVI